MRRAVSDRRGALTDALQDVDQILVGVDFAQTAGGE
jgi:hypothetical protein